MNAQNLQSSVECARQIVPLVKDRNHQVGAHRYPDLGFHRIGTRAVVMFDSQVALDPAEEQFDSPAQLVEHRHSERGNFEVIGQKHEGLAGFQIDEFDAPQKHRIVASGFLDRGLADMIAPQAGETIDRLRVMPREAQVALGACNEEGTCFCDQRQASEVHVATVHQVEGTRLEEQFVEPVHIVLARPCNADAGGNGATQIDLGVHLDAGLGLAKVGPVEERERQVDGGRIQGVDRVVQVDAKILADVERSCLADEVLGEVLPDAPVARLVGIGKCGLGDFAGEAEVIECFGPRVETGGNVAQSIPARELGEHHADELLTEAEVTCGGVGLVSIDDAVEGLAVNQIEDLGNDEASSVHAPECSKIAERSSNASHPFFALSCSSTKHSKS